MGFVKKTGIPVKVKKMWMVRSGLYRQRDFGAEREGMIGNHLLTPGDCDYIFGDFKRAKSHNVKQKKI